MCTLFSNIDGILICKDKDKWQGFSLLLLKYILCTVTYVIGVQE